MPSSIQLVRLREREREEREERERRGTFRAILSEWESRVNTKSVARCLPALLPALIWNDGGGVTGCDNQQDCVFDASSDLVKTAKHNRPGLRTQYTCFADSAMDGLV